MQRAPWDQSTIDRLNKYQADGQFHPYTCGNNSQHVLQATPNGWICPVEGCGYVQDWAHFIPTQQTDGGNPA